MGCPSTALICLSVVLIFSNVGILSVNLIIFPSLSSVDVCSPHLISNSYSLTSELINGINFVVFPIAIGRIPSAKGSSVPP